MVTPVVEILVFFFLSAAGFLAGFVDSVVGGGGLISIPALLLCGVSPSVVLGTNKLAGTMATLTSTISFAASDKVNFSLIKYLFPFSLLGATLGAHMVKYIPSQILKPLIIVLLICVSIYTLRKKDWGSISTYAGRNKKNIWLGAAVAAGLGFYDGFFGPGTGSFLIFAFLQFGFDFVVAAGNAKVLNFASNIASLATFILMGAVNYSYGITMGITMVIGALLGSRLAITKGTAFVRLMFIAIILLLVGKQVWDLLH